MTQFDFDILDLIQKWTNPVFDFFFKYITHLGDAGVIWIVTAVILLFFKKTRKCGIMMGCALILGLLVGNLGLKNLIGRQRPFIQRPEMEAMLLISPPGGFSFPSGHTLASVECATVILLNNKKWGIPAITLALLIAFSRLYLYVHFPSDVIAAAILGIAIGVFVYYMYQKFIDKKIKI